MKRPDAEELLAIRAGAWKYDDLISWADDKVAMMDKWKDDSPLPHSPDITRLNQLCVELHQDFYLAKA